ncbi:hypothetical protein NESM_000435700 [Novymonas esmeraldas]|uniref:EF-hand domain-containing protein n=1 Tax=Novymonas esmeraldas TaxID=1808958 RepID=A0AAW0EN84_9TRYP
MQSDTESLAFVEETDSPPPPRQRTDAPAAAPTRPRITTMPRLHPPSPPPAKTAPAKPPLHSSSPNTAAGTTSAAAHPARPTTPGKQAKADTASEFSDNESIFFAVDNGSVAGTPMRGGGAPSATPPAPVARSSPAAAAAPAPRRLSRTGSGGSIQFNSEPGSRNTSPGPKARMSLRAATPAEKTAAPGSATRGAVTTESSISFFDHGGEGGELGSSPPIHPHTEKRATPAVTGGTRAPAGRAPLTGAAAAAAAAAGNSMVTNDSIAFQVEDDSGVMQSHSSATPHPSKAFIAMGSSSGMFPGRRAGRSNSIAESAAGDFTDNGSIAFMVEDDTDGRGPPRRVSLGQLVKRDTGTPKAAPLHRSHSAQSRPPSRPASPSIQFDQENTDNESVTERSDPLFGERGSPPLTSHKLPVFSHSFTPTSSPIPDVLACSQTDTLRSHAGAGGVLGSSAPTSRPAKKTIVMNRLRQAVPVKQHSRLPQPRKKSPTPLLEEGDLSPSRSATHPPLYKPVTVATPLAAQAARAMSVSSAGGSRKGRSTTVSERNMPTKKDTRAAAHHHHGRQLSSSQPQRRSKESASSRTAGASPNQKLATEEGSTASTESPPEPLFTGHRSHASTELPSAAVSPVRVTQAAFPAHTQHGSAHSSVQGYLTSQQAENQLYRRHHDSLHHRHAHGAAASRSGGGMSVSGTLEEAEQWRQFNQQQRAELVELRRRIAIARRLDCTLLEGPLPPAVETRVPAPMSRSLVPQPTPRAVGYGGGAATRAQETHRPVSSGYGAAAKGSGRRGAPTPAETRGPSPVSRPGSARRGDGTARSATAPSSSAAVRPGAAPPQPTPRPGAQSPVTLLQSAAAASVADMLGLLWPPRLSVASRGGRQGTHDGSPSYRGRDDTSAVDLYFVTGSRLTAAQVERFFDLVRAQLDADAAAATKPHGAVAHTLSPTKLRQRATAAVVHGGGGSGGGGGAVLVHPGELDSRERSLPRTWSPARAHRGTAPLSARLAALLPRKAVRRSRVLREVFDVMDLKRQGTIVLEFLPSLARLFEGELAAIEHARAALLHGTAAPLQSLLDAAAASRALHASSWCGTRGGAAGIHGEPGTMDDGALGHEGLAPDAQADAMHLTHRLLLLSFAVNVVIPIVSSSRIPLLDFSTLCMLVYAAVDNVDHAMDAPREEWRQVVQQYFHALAA